MAIFFGHNQGKQVKLKKTYSAVIYGSSQKAVDYLKARPDRFKISPFLLTQEQRDRISKKGGFKLI